VAHAAAHTSNINDNWLFYQVEGTLGPCSMTVNIESIGGRSNCSGQPRGLLRDNSYWSTKVTVQVAEQRQRAQHRRGWCGRLLCDSMQGGLSQQRPPNELKEMVPDATFDLALRVLVDASSTYRECRETCQCPRNLES
jgi:hypothetical protein